MKASLTEFPSTLDDESSSYVSTAVYFSLKNYCLPYYDMVLILWGLENKETTLMSAWLKSMQNKQNLLISFSVVLLEFPG